MHLSIRNAIKQTVVIIANYVQNFIQHPHLKDNSICITYCRSSMWIWTKQVDY